MMHYVARSVRSPGRSIKPMNISSSIFFCSSLKRDVSAYIKTCQRTGKPNQTIEPAPLFPIPVVGLA